MKSSERVRCISCSKGLTLVDVMIGVLVIGIVMAGCLSSLSLMRRTIIKSEQVQVGAMLLNSEMEKFRSMQFPVILEQARGGLAGGTSSVEATDISFGGYDFERRVNLEAIALNGISDEAVRVKITLLWELGGQSMSVDNQSLFALGGLSDKHFSDAN